MKILIISNTSDKVRSENILKQFAGQNTKYDYEIVEAIMNYDQPSVGIKRSFCKAIQKAKDNNWSEVMILEDDFCCLHLESLMRFINTYKMYKPNTALLLAGMYEGEIYPLYEGFYRVDGKLSGLHAMIVPEALYDVILKAEEPFHLDWWISMEAKIPAYVCYPFLIIQNDGYSANVRGMTNYNEGLKLKYKLINHGEK